MLIPQSDLELPHEWKVARVTPIPKGMVSSDPAKFQPISLLSVLSKLLEPHVKNILLKLVTVLLSVICSGDSLVASPLLGLSWLPQITGIKHLTLEVRLIQYFLTIVIKAFDSVPHTEAETATKSGGARCVERRAKLC